MENIIFQQAVMAPSCAIDRSTPTEVLVTVERNCCIVWLRCAEYPTGCLLDVTRSEDAARRTAARLATSKSHLGLMNIADALRLHLTDPRAQTARLPPASIQEQTA